jgi:hypothetical protein
VAGPRRSKPSACSCPASRPSCAWRWPACRARPPAAAACACCRTRSTRRTHPTTPPPALSPRSTRCARRPARGGGGVVLMRITRSRGLTLRPHIAIHTLPAACAEPWPRAGPLARAQPCALPCPHARAPGEPMQCSPTLHHPAHPSVRRPCRPVMTWRAPESAPPAPPHIAGPHAPAHARAPGGSRRPPPPPAPYAPHEHHGRLPHSRVRVCPSRMYVCVSSTCVCAPLCRRPQPLGRLPRPLLIRRPRTPPGASHKGGWSSGVPACVTPQIAC